MTSDIICDATVKYIIDSEQHLDLAFCVERAMPIVRKRLVEKVVKDVEEKFSESDCWRVVSTDYGNVMETHRSLIVLRKNGWYEHGNKDPRTGIHLSSDKNFSAPYICLHSHESYIDEKGEDIVGRFGEFNKYRRHKRTDERPREVRLREGIMWKYAESGDWQSWQSKDFFKWAANSEKREEIVKRFVCMIDDMAAEIDDTMKNLGPNA